MKTETDREVTASLVLEALARLDAVAKEPIPSEENGGYARAFGRLEMCLEIEASYIRTLLAREARSR